MIQNNRFPLNTPPAKRAIPPIGVKLYGWGNKRLKAATKTNPANNHHLFEINFDIIFSLFCANKVTKIQSTLHEANQKTKADLNAFLRIHKSSIIRYVLYGDSIRSILATRGALQNKNKIDA